MKVAIVSPGFEHGGGVAAVAEFLFNGLRGGRYLPEIISPAVAFNDDLSTHVWQPQNWARGPCSRTKVVRGYSVREIGAQFSELESQRYQARAEFDRNLAYFDIVQFVAGTSAWAYAARRLRQPVFLQVATLVEAERASLFREPPTWRIVPQFINLKMAQRVEQKAIHIPRKIFVENIWLRDRLRSELGNERVVFAPPSIDIDYFHPPLRYNRAGFILSTGRIGDDRKNKRLLLEAYVRVRQARPDAPGLVLAGSRGPFARDEQFIRESGLEKHVTVIVNPPRERLAELYREAALFVLSSDEEGLGLVLMEAMASGLPVISTDCGGPATVIDAGVNGLLTPVRNVERLAAAILQLIDDKDMALHMGFAGRKRMETEFSPRICLGRFTDAYDEVIDAAKVQIA